jgi:hypothetical protein
MTAATATFIVLLVCTVLFAALVAFALHTKGDVRATGRIGAGTFSIEASEKTK